MTDVEKEMILAIRNSSNPEDLMQQAFQFIYDYYHSLELNPSTPVSEHREVS